MDYRPFDQITAFNVGNEVHTSQLQKDGQRRLRVDVAPSILTEQVWLRPDIQAVWVCGRYPCLSSR